MFIIFFVIIFFMFFTRLARIYLIYSCSRIIEEQCRWMKDHPFDRPTQKMNTKIMALRQNLIGYAKGASQLFPLEGYYSSQLQRKIDLMFTQISEGLYGQNIEALREEGSEQSKKEIVDFYQTLEDWNLKLSLNIFRDRNYTHSLTLKNAQKIIRPILIRFILKVLSTKCNFLLFHRGLIEKMNYWLSCCIIPKNIQCREPMI